VDKLVADVELRYRSVNSAETDNSSLVIDHPELANSERNDLGSISGYHALQGWAIRCSQVGATRHREAECHRWRHGAQTPLVPGWAAPWPVRAVAPHGFRHGFRWWTYQACCPEHVTERRSQRAVFIAALDSNPVEIRVEDDCLCAWLAGGVIGARDGGSGGGCRVAVGEWSA
jgi:hypothetical protein